MITAEDIMRDADVAKLAGLKVATFQRKMKRGFKSGELDWKAADPVSNGRERLWFRKDVERVWRERIRAAPTDTVGVQKVTSSNLVAPTIEIAADGRGF